MFMRMIRFHPAFRQRRVKIHLKAGVGNDQSLKCATSISNVDYWIVTGITLGVNKQPARSVAFKIQVKEFGKTFRTIFFGSCSSDTGSVHIPLDPFNDRDWETDLAGCL